MPTLKIPIKGKFVSARRRNQTCATSVRYPRIGFSPANRHAFIEPDEKDENEIAQEDKNAAGSEES